MKIPVYKIAIPQYTIRQKPDNKAVGKEIDKIIKKYFVGKRLVIRAISSKEHKGKSLDELIAIIKRAGTDRYNPKIRGDRYENLGNKHIDFFALERKITPQAKIMWQFIWSFYDWPITHNEKPTRIDLVILYDPKQVKRVLHTYDGKRYKRDGYVFRDPQNKQLALKGFIKIL